MTTEDEHQRLIDEIEGACLREQERLDKEHNFMSALSKQQVFNIGFRAGVRWGMDYSSYKRMKKPRRGENARTIH